MESAKIVSLDAHRPFTIGGSEAAAACGVDPYRSRVMLWAEKTGRYQREPTEAMHWGKLVEPVVIDELRRRDYVVFANERPTYQHRELPWLVGTPDGFTEVDGERAVLEVKTGSSYTAHDWSNEIGAPVPALMQVHHYMLLTDCERGLLAALVGGQRLELREVRRDNAVIEAMVKREQRFLDFVRTDTPPPPDGSDSARDAIRAMYAAGSERTVRLDVDTYRAVQELRQLREQRKAIEQQEAERAQRVQLAMGDAEYAVSPYDTPAAKWSTVTSARLDTTALRAARPEIYAEFAATHNTRRFTVE